jgi:hypothetical protein
MAKPGGSDGKGIARRFQLNLDSEVDAMSDSIIGNSGVNIDAAKRQGKALFKQSVDAARSGVSAAREGLRYAQDHAGDGADAVKSVANTVTEFVYEQPLIAVAGAFIIGYMAARIMRRISA